MHVALLTDGIAPFVTGGMQRHSQHLAKGLLELGVKITLVHCVPFGESLPTEEEVKKELLYTGGDLCVIGLNFPKAKKRIGHYVRESYRYSCDVYERLQPILSEFDFIYAKGFSGWNLLEQKKKGSHLPPIGIKFHGYEMFQKTHGIKSRLESFLLRPGVVFISRHADMVFSYGGHITDIIKRIGVDQGRIVEIGSAVAASWITDVPIPQKDKRRFLFIGRNEKRKGVADLAECSLVFLDTHSEMHWVGPMPKLLRIQNEAHTYYGEIRDSEKLRSTIDGCQVLILPSHSEGMPNVVLEAMARGLAVVATNVGAVSRMVSESNGRLIPAHNKTALTSAIRELAEMDHPSLTKLRQSSINKVKKEFNWNNVAKDTASVIAKATFSTLKNPR